MPPLSRTNLSGLLIFLLFSTDGYIACLFLNSKNICDTLEFYCNTDDAHYKISTIIPSERFQLLKKTSNTQSFL